MKTTDHSPIAEHPLYGAIAALLISLVSGPALADDYDKFELSVGGYAVFKYDSKVALTETNVGAGITLSPRDTFGLDSEDTVFRLDGRYRFRENHALRFSWYRISSKSSKNLLDDIEWIDKDGNTVIIPTGTRIASSLGYDLFKVDYQWSFYQSDKVELSAGAGLHWANIGLKLSAESGLFDTELREAKSDLPMPVGSFGLEYKVTPKFNWYLRTQLFALELPEWSGLYSDFLLGIDYQLFEHFGVGAALGSNALDVIREYDNLRFEFDNRISGLHFFVSANF
jgi:hypothetical protein